MPTSDPGENARGVAPGSTLRRASTPGRALRRAAGAAGTWVVLPVLALVGAILIAIALVEGPPLENFLYAVF